MNENEAFDQVISDGSLPELAQASIKKWQDKHKTVWRQRETDAGTVEAALRKLLSSGLMTATELAAADVSKRVNLAMAAVKVFQALADDLPVDGILGRKTVKAMHDFLGCNQRKDRGAELPETSAARRINETFASPDRPDRLAVIICNISEEVEKHFDRMFHGSESTTRDLIVDAWDLWDVPRTAGLARKLCCTDDPDNANVLITLAAIDGRAGGILADAHVGGPNVKQQLTLRIDEEERFSPETFVAVVGHELGHILGLRHLPARGHLMSAFFDPTRITPTDTDLAHLKRLWS